MTGCPDRELLAVLVEREPAHAASLAAALETHHVTVAQRCAQLQGEGRVRQVSGGAYETTADGIAYLETLEE